MNEFSNRKLLGSFLYIYVFLSQWKLENSQHFRKEIGLPHLMSNSVKISESERKFNNNIKISTLKFIILLSKVRDDQIGV